MREYPNPCGSCTRKHCPNVGYCEAWITRYLYRQKQINAYAKKHGIAPVQTDMTEDPCKKCSIRYYCDTICPARAKWWDVCMERLREGVGCDL